MSMFGIALLVGAVIVGSISWNTPRAVLWIILAMADFLASHFYWTAGLPYAEGFTGACDTAVCLSLYFLSKERWELLVWRLFQTSVAINFLYLAGNLGIFYRLDTEVYSVLMEAVNWLVLLLIFGVAMGQRFGVDDAGAGWLRHSLHRSFAALRKARKTPQFFAVK